jgi:hypothetical protein
MQIPEIFILLSSAVGHPRYPHWISTYCRKTRFHLEAWSLGLRLSCERERESSCRPFTGSYLTHPSKEKEGGKEPEDVFLRQEGDQALPSCKETRKYSLISKMHLLHGRPLPCRMFMRIN